jgi:CO/xanthine dehydrogenase FAD-binding subunit
MPAAGAESVRSRARTFVSLFTTDLDADEILTRIEVPVVEASEGWAFMEFSRRHGDFALASVAVRLRLVAGKIEGPVRIALGAAADRVIRARRAEATVEGREPSSALFDASATEAAAEIDPMTDIHGSADYRRHLVLGLVKAALAKAVERASPKH